VGFFVKYLSRLSGGNVVILDLDLPVHRKAHLFLVVWNGRMDFMEPETNLRCNIPPKCAANDACSEQVEASLVISQHDRKVLRHIVEKNMEWRRRQ
jgi:hypothetical protein